VNDIILSLTVMGSQPWYKGAARRNIKSNNMVLCFSQALNTPHAQICAIGIPSGKSVQLINPNKQMLIKKK